MNEIDQSLEDQTVCMFSEIKYQNGKIDYDWFQNGNTTKITANQSYITLHGVVRIVELGFFYSIMFRQLLLHFTGITATCAYPSKKQV
jgi:hypothetical protein